MRNIVKEKMKNKPAPQRRRDTETTVMGFFDVLFARIFILRHEENIYGILFLNFPVSLGLCGERFLGRAL
jgi:hypothetical protein